MKIAALCGIETLPLRWVLLFLYPSLSHQASSVIFSVKVESPVSGLLGSSVSLHCAVTNNMDVRNQEVRWYRPKMYDTPILLYENKQIQKSRVDVQYQGRVFLLGDLEKGDVSVKLENLTLADRGDYTCHVSTDMWYDKATVTLRLRVVGSTPVLSIHEAGEGKVNVSCQSHGWVPEPSITWTDKDGRDLKHLSNDTFTNILILHLLHPLQRLILLPSPQIPNLLSPPQIPDPLSPRQRTVTRVMKLRKSTASSLHHRMGSGFSVMKEIKEFISEIKQK
ncbi:butyrophilin subfamily 2 member A2-like [Clarias gariepinus]|uniref:butyrophilin subfamily 2 member A2-like n=1 Tax=Clarias gariepinus TaxID=13013 RepID=UPI00234D81ED|nr:butyrophilin subfamily 2 member A2-like [Clarias gariepinus]